MNKVKSSANFASRTLGLDFVSCSVEGEEKSRVAMVYACVSFWRCVIFGVWVMRWMCRMVWLEGGETSTYVVMASEAESCVGADKV